MTAPVNETRSSPGIIDPGDLCCAYPGIWERLQSQPCFTRDPDTISYRIAYYQGVLQLVSLKQRFKPLFVDFGEKRRLHGKDLLGRAIGKKSRTVVDATAGLGRDALHIAMGGRRVTMIEKHPVFFALLYDGLQRINDPELSTRLALVYGDSQSEIKNHAADAAYLDPMFTHVSSSALPGRDLQILRDLVPANDDGQSLARIALQNFPRVVIKRSDSATPLIEPVSHSHVGKAVRYDVYLQHGTYE